MLGDNRLNRLFIKYELPYRVSDFEQITEWTWRTEKNIAQGMVYQLMDREIDFSYHKEGILVVDEIVIIWENEKDESN